MITYTPLRPNIHVVDNNFHQQWVTYSQYCGKLELLNVYFSVILNHTLHGTVIELSVHRYNAVMPILQSFLLLLQSLHHRFCGCRHMYSLIFAVIVSLFCYCGNNYTIFNTFYYDEPTPKIYQAALVTYK